jgi:hypothetical protein
MSETALSSQQGGRTGAEPAECALMVVGRRGNHRHGALDGAPAGAGWTARIGSPRVARTASSCRYRPADARSSSGTAERAGRDAAGVEEIVAITDEFCSEQLDEEYAPLCRRLTVKAGSETPLATCAW